jgi:adenylate cyclase class 2
MRNLEFKARYPNLRRAARLSKELGAGFLGRLRQTDTYFHVPTGRLKLREIIHRDAGGKLVETSAELIGYHRPNKAAARTSRYEIVLVSHPRKMKRLLGAFLGVQSVVRKTRDVYLLENLRIHLDRVARLGSFVEFELIVTPKKTLAQCGRRMRQLLAEFAIGPSQLIAGSYADLKAAD